MKILFSLSLLGFTFVIPEATNSSEQLLAQTANMSCGIPPIPPIGCRVGACVCDQTGMNCQWTMVCN